ncbi:MAG TPA: protein kinase [Gemmatimonadaceae bacterium]|nr:protein kinase [Gemmatimonadaceae bacterium]
MDAERPAGSSADDAELQQRIRSVLGAQYTVERELGRGGMGIVYRARDLRLKREVAIKLLPPELAFRHDIRTRFLREAETAAGLSHPHIVPIYSVDEREGLVYFVMGFVDGETLAERLMQRGALPVAEVQRIVREVADALALAHARGVVHRDIKPDNVMIDRSSGRVTVTDFGIARAATGDGVRLTATGIAIGTPAYMSPEQCAGERDVDGRSDLYSLGVVAYQMLTGSLPFSAATTPAMLVKHLSEVPVDVRTKRKDVPASLAAIVMKLLAKAPEDRYPDGAALLAALETGAVPAPPPTQSVRAKPRGVDVVREEIGREMSFHESRAARRAAKHRARQAEIDALPREEKVKRFRRQLAGYVGTSLLLAGINIATSPDTFWAIFPILGMGVGVFKAIGNLWADGVRMREVFGRDVVAPALPDGVAKPAAIGGADDDYAATLREASTDRAAIDALLAGLAKSERQLLPDDIAATADGLMARMTAIAGALRQLREEIGADRLTRVDDQIRAVEQRTPGAGDDSRDRRLALLRRQRDQLAGFQASRERLEQQFEHAGLLLKNLRLDLVHVRASGLKASLEGLTSITQEARALSRDIGHVLAAAEEVKALDGRS